MIRIKLKQVVRRKGSTLTEVAAATGISMNTLSVLGRGESKGIQFETLDKICTFLTCTPNDILGFENNSLDIFMNSSAELVAGSKLFSGELLSVDAIEDAQERGTSPLTGFPFFIELPADSKSDTIFVDCGLPKSSIQSFKDGDTAPTNTYSLQEAEQFLRDISDDERQNLMLSAGKMAKECLAPASFRKAKRILVAWYDDPFKMGIFPVLQLPDQELE